MSLPRSVADVGRHYATLQAQIVEEALALLAPTIRKGKASPEVWRDSIQTVGNRLLLLQVLAASYADAYLNDILEAQNADGGSEGRVNPQAFADLTDGGGSWLQALVYAPNSVRPPSGADWSRFGFVANSIVKTGLGDTARAAVQSGMQARPSVTGYVRMLRGTSCARCAILAGRHYKSAVAFNRHKRCDCIHVPAAEDVDDDWTTDPDTYFRSLSREEQDRLFTKTGAETIRMGGDMAQVVNARQGITTAQAFGQDVQATTVGTTRRGLAGQRLQGRIPRLLPDEIFLQAERLGWDRAETLRQLRRFAYVL
ncbi:MAG: hypothetical protein WBA97_34520 [Actinophytocola sp.]|uniref:VG15 protein n=1 Tax=Actinophytocola sp. TaxID=1872138 RepID=UPI003C78661C